MSTNGHNSHAPVVADQTVTGYGPARHAQPFPYWDRRRLLGEWTVEESVERIVNYKWAEIGRAHV